MKNVLNNAQFARNKVFLLSLVFQLLFLSCEEEVVKNSSNLNIEKQEEPVFSVFITHDSIIQWKHKINAQWVVKNHDKIVADDSIRIKYRGGVSRQYPKHSLSLDSKNKLSIGELAPRKRWILNANYIDKTFIRHTFHFELFRKMAPRNVAPRFKYVQLYINKAYTGLYVLMERTNEEMLLDQQNSKYPIIFKEPPLFYVDYTAKLTDTVNPFHQKHPSLKDTNMNALLVEASTFLHDSSDSLFKREVFSWFDRENIIDWHLILLLSNNGDGVLKNFYLYKKEVSQPFRIAIWDYDHSLGRDGDNELNLIRSGIQIKRNKLFERLITLNPNSYLEHLSNRWEELRFNQFSKEFLTALKDSLIEIITPEIQRNEEKWPYTDTTWYYDTADFYQEVALIDQFFLMQLPRLDSLVLEG